MCERLLQNISKNQQGSALIYILFITVFVGIVLTVMLTTVTQGQRFIVQYEDKLAKDYLTEAAFQIVLHEIEQYEGGAYAYLQDHLAAIDEQVQLKLMTIEAQEMTVDGIKISVENDNGSNKITAKILNRDDQQLFRFIQAYEEEELDIGDPGAPDEPEEPTPPDDGIQDGEAYVYYPDTNDYRIVPMAELATGQINELNGQLVVPESHAPIVVASGVNYHADRGIYLGTHLTLQNGDINMSASNGDLQILGDVSAPSSIMVNNANNVYFGNNEISGTVTISANNRVDLKEASFDSPGDATFSSDILRGDGFEINSGSHAEFESINEMYFINSNITSGNDLTFNSDKTLSVRDTNMSSNQDFTVVGTDSVTLNGSYLYGPNNFYLESGGTFTAMDSEIDSTGGTDALEIKSGADMIINGMTLLSELTLYVESGGHLQADGAYLDVTRQNNQANLEVFAQGNISIVNANIVSNRNLYVESEGHIYADGVHMEANNHPAQSRIDLHAEGNIFVNHAYFNTRQALEFELNESSHTIELGGAEFRVARVNDLARARPNGVNMSGTPAFGCMTNNQQTICP